MMNSLRNSLITFFIVFLVATSAGAEDDAKQRFYLKDGTTISGEVLSETEDAFIVKSSLGELTIEKANLRTRFARLILKDTTVLLGKLLGEHDFYVVETSMGVVKIEKERVESFEVQFAPVGVPESAVNVGRLFGKVPGKKEDLSKGFGHSIEPLIDIFFSPTGYVFKKGDLYVSGLSLAYGFSDSFLMSVNGVSLAGLNVAGEINPNFEAKLNLVDYRDDGLEYFVSVGTKASLFEHVGNYWITYEDEAEVSRTKHRRWNEYERENEDEDDPERPEGEPSPSDENRNNRRTETDEAIGWQTQFYVAQSLSFLLDRGGRLGVHLGGQFELNSFNIDELDNPKRQSYRLHLAFDIDLSRRFKLLGEVFYDKDRVRSMWTEEEGPVGIDFGLMYAFTQNFRLQVHIQPYIIGLYWRI